jgi:2-haloacid dehalogenase
MTVNAYVFDAYGTLFDVHSAVRSHAAAVGPHCEAVSALWRTKQLEYSWVRSLMNRYVDFWRCTQDALTFALQTFHLHDQALKDRLLSAYWSLAAYSDVKATLQTLRERGAKLAILSNGTPQMLEAAVGGAGIGDLFDAVISVDGLRIYKTAPETYRLVTTRLDVQSQSVSFQSSNGWDIAGASAFGFRCVRINRGAVPAEYGDIAMAPEVQDLRGLLRLDGP